ncbi:omptin family outer membrane protease [Devosia sp. FKR38]|uniref:omptin family outer membrane protease n=1 Tax=Devosia sp. FKR38 TaxID=2562312 RepID=UPI0010C0A151|nr:omptin family outer membrane protease [Devosia sp. FKR38]
MTTLLTACRTGLMLALLTSGALAQDYSYTSPDSAVRINGGIGALYLRGNEYVFTGDATLSQLIWETRAPVLRGSLAVDVGSGVSLSAEGSVAGFGSSYMEDYDWLIRTNNFDNWTHRSQHPDTRLEHYVTGAAMVGYDLVKDPDAVVRVQAGVKYTDVKWAAYGGSYVYSVNTFRDTTGNFGDGVPGISYRQKLPELFVGFDGDQTYGNVRVGGMLRGGLTVMGRAEDNHWMRNLLVIDSFRPAPTFAAGLDVGFALGPLAEFVVAARYDQAFLMRGKAEYFDTRTGVRTIVDDNSAGGDLRSAEITAGLRGRF